MKNKKFGLIYADPPWRYNFCKSKNRKIENHYPTMDLEDIKNLPVQKICDDNSILFLWATAPKLREALEVMNAWGFEYKSHAIWDKQKIGTGYWFRGQHELLLIGIKGRVNPPKENLREPSIFSFPRTEHSKKPSQIRTFIANWFPGMEKIELFAREKIAGWDSFGDEVNSDIELIHKEVQQEDILPNFI